MIKDVQSCHLSSHSRSGLHPHLRTLQRKRDCNGKMRVDMVMPCVPISLCGCRQTSRPHLHLSQITSRRRRSSKVGSTIVRLGIWRRHSTAQLGGRPPLASAARRISESSRSQSAGTVDQSWIYGRTASGGSTSPACPVRCRTASASRRRGIERGGGSPGSRAGSVHRPAGPSTFRIRARSCSTFVPVLETCH
jgi:hypothetical protein